MTHRELVRRMAKWLKYSRQMTVVVSELSTRNSETPDVIGWKGGAHSILVECKMSRSDFFADSNKPCRRAGGLGMGDVRYYAAPKGVLSENDMPPLWGLLEVDEHRVRVALEASHQDADKRSECVVLMSALRRLEISTAVYVVAESAEPEA